MVSSTIHLAKYAVVWLLFSFLAAFYLGVFRPEQLYIMTDAEVDKWCFGMGVSLTLLYYGLKNIWCYVLRGDIHV